VCQYFSVGLRQASPLGKITQRWHLIMKSRGSAPQQRPPRPMPQGLPAECLQRWPGPERASLAQPVRPSAEVSARMRDRKAGQRSITKARSPQSGHRLEQSPGDGSKDRSIPTTSVAVISQNFNITEIPPAPLRTPSELELLHRRASIWRLLALLHPRPCSGSLPAALDRTLRSL
jgi:hypothetical protein